MNKLFNKWKSLTPVAKTSLVLVFAKFFQKGLAFITAPVFTRIMPLSQYGIISTFTSWQSVLYIVATLNMSMGVFNNGMIDFKEDRDNFTFSILMLANLFTFGLMAIYIICQSTINNILELPQILIWIMLAYFFVTPAYNYWMGRQRFEFKYINVLLLSLISSIVPTLLAVVFVLLVPIDTKAIAKVSATELSAIAIGLIFYLQSFVKSEKKINIDYWKYALKFNLPLIPHYLSLYVLASSDRIMISKLIDNSATAIYSVAYTAASTILIFWNSVDAAYAPWIYQKMDEKEYSSINKRGEQVIYLFALCTIFVTLFAPEFIKILGPKDYYEGVYVIPSVVAGVFFTAVFSLYMRVELYLKKSVTIMIATCIAAISNLILNFIFIPIFGYVAAGYTTLVCYIMLALFHAINLKRIGYGFVYSNKRVFFISTLICILIVSMSLTYSFSVVRYLLIFVVSIILVKNKNKLIDLVKKK